MIEPRLMKMNQKGYPIEKMDIRKINDETIAKHLTNVLSGGQIIWRALKDTFGYMDGTFEKAIKDHLIDENPCKYIDLGMTLDEVRNILGQEDILRNEGFNWGDERELVYNKKTYSIRSKVYVRFVSQIQV